MIEIQVRLPVQILWQISRHVLLLPLLFHDLHELSQYLYLVCGFQLFFLKP